MLYPCILWHLNNSNPSKDRLVSRFDVLRYDSGCYCVGCNLLRLLRVYAPINTSRGCQQQNHRIAYPFTWYKSQTSTNNFFSRDQSTVGSPATPASSSNTTIPSILSIPISEKLTKTNYTLRRAQVLPALRAGQFEGLLNGVDLAPINPAYTSWVTRDQAAIFFPRSRGRRYCTFHGAPPRSRPGAPWPTSTHRRPEHVP
jgi:hypothetical protein